MQSMQAPVWHPDVRFFQLSVKAQPKAYFYLDPYSRPEEKRGGAWMAEVRPWGSASLHSRFWLIQGVSADMPSLAIDAVE